MDVETFVAALAIPASCRVDQRVPKKLLTEHGAPTTVDKRQIQDGVDEIVWIASLKPHLIGVESFKDVGREYLEIAVLHLALTPRAQLRRLVALLHRAVPYPTLLLTTSEAGLSASMAHLRPSQNEVDKLVIDGDLLHVGIPAATDCLGFGESIALARQPQSNLYVLYQGWMDVLDALDIAGVTGQFQTSATRDLAIARHAALQASRLLRLKLAQFRAQASTERQIARRVMLNQSIQDGEAELAQLEKVLRCNSA